MPTPEELYNYPSERNASNTANAVVKYLVHPATPSESMPPKKQTWDDIWLKFMESEQYADCLQAELFSTYAKWLEANYKAPERK